VAKPVEIRLYADTGEIKRLAERIGASMRVVRPAFRHSALGAAMPVLADARARASYSHRIPAAMRVRMVGNLVVEIIVDGNAAPDAAPIENKGRGFVRHPTFARGGDRSQWHWTNKNSHPAFLRPALDAHRAEVELAIEAGVIDAVERTVGGH